MLNRLIDTLQAKFPPNRLVALALALLLPTVIVPVSGYVAVWVPAHFPGLPAYTPAQYTAFAITGIGAALLAGITAGYKFIDGWQKKEGREVTERLEHLAQEHEKVLAVLKADNPHVAQSILDDLGAPSAAVNAAVPASPTAVVTPPLTSGLGAPAAPPRSTIPVPKPETDLPPLDEEF